MFPPGLNTNECEGKAQCIFINFNFECPFKLENEASCNRFLFCINHLDVHNPRVQE